MFQNMSWKTAVMFSTIPESTIDPSYPVFKWKIPSIKNSTHKIWPQRFGQKKHCNLRQKTSIETEDFNWDRRLGQFVLRWIGHQLLGPKFEQCQAFVCASCFSDLDMFFNIIFGNQGRSHSRWMACLSSVNKYDMIHWYRYPYEKKIYHNQKKSNICF